jgi:hypothetical protein
MGQLVAGFPGGVPTMNPSPSPLRFGSSGFSPGLTDDNHPARHFTANLVLGFREGYHVSAAAALLREIPRPGCNGCSGEDVILGEMGASLGAMIRNGEISRNAVAQFIRDNL